MTNGYYIGQRVFYKDREIVLIKDDQYMVSPNTDARQWVRTVNNVDLYVDVQNLKRLPRGQL